MAPTARRRVGMAVVAACVFAGLLSFGPATAQSDQDQLDEIGREIENLRTQIEAAEQTRSEYGRQLADTQERMAALLVELEAAQSALDTIVNNIVDQEATITEVERKIDLLAAELAATQLEQRSTRNTVQDRAVDLYMNGVFGVGSAVFAVDNATNLTVGFEYADNLLTNTEVLLRSLEVLEIQEERQKVLLGDERALQAEVLAELEGQRAEAEAHKSDLDGLRLEVEEVVASQQALIASINSDIAHMDDHLANRESDYAALEREIVARQSGEGSNPGILAWPLPGPVTSPYGNRIHPITGAVRLHKGIDLAGPSGTPIGAAGGGTVILAQSFGGFGNAVVIDHGGGLATLYAHQSGLNVSAGQQVSAGDTVGWVGSTGFSTGPHLHFETHENGVAVDPLRYLNG